MSTTHYLSDTYSKLQFVSLALYRMTNRKYKNHERVASNTLGDNITFD